MELEQRRVRDQRINILLTGSFAILAALVGALISIASRQPAAPAVAPAPVPIIITVVVPSAPEPGP
jgi:hypothetical protein